MKEQRVNIANKSPPQLILNQFNSFQLSNNHLSLNKKNMKTEFTVHQDNITAFAEILEANELDNSITGVNEDGLLIIDVHYSKAERDAIEELEDIADSDE